MCVLSRGALSCELLPRESSRSGSGAPPQQRTELAGQADPQSSSWEPRISSNEIVGVQDMIDRIDIVLYDIHSRKDFHTCFVCLLGVIRKMRIGYNQSFLLVGDVFLSVPNKWIMIPNGSGSWNLKPAKLMELGLRSGLTGLTGLTQWLKASFFHVQMGVSWNGDLLVGWFISWKIRTSNGWYPLVN